ncbi:MAG: 3' terminal RNA ribose 2'-O-methyltransferase Hen1 [Acidobacteria bacterium]|nr:3' terminal RNA ribose 2'-O-methyltransferase Hen1 [Acidobacteriota bacterium]
MLLQIAVQGVEANQIGYLLHKNPANLHHRRLSFGEGWVFFDTNEKNRVSFNLYVEVDPIRLSRQLDQSPSFDLKPYVNDRPYVANSYLSVALNVFFRSAIAELDSDSKPHAKTEHTVTVHLPVVSMRGDASIFQRVFEPLGYGIQLQKLPFADPYLDPDRSPLYALTLSVQAPIGLVLRHLYVLIPVLDKDKHYFVGSDEIEKLLRAGQGWLENHPAKELITQRYLLFSGLSKQALSRIEKKEEALPDQDDSEPFVEKKIHLNELRIQRVVEMLLAQKASQVLDMGCGSGTLLQHLLSERSITKLTGVDASINVLQIAERKLKLDRLSTRMRQKIQLIQSGLTYRDARLLGHDAIALIEVIEHLDSWRLKDLTQVIFDYLKPRLLIVTTPNREYNALFENMPADSLRHSDHRFEWTRSEFTEWCQEQCKEWEYQVEFSGIGPEHEQYGCPTQMGVFTKHAD